MTESSVTMTLAIGGLIPAPVSDTVARAVQSVVVTASDSSPSGFQISFNAERSMALVGDYPLLRDDTLKPFNRVVITVRVGSSSTILMDGFITHQQLVPGSSGRGATLTVTGEDVSVLMDMVDVPVPFPAMGDAAIVALVLAKWATVGIIPEIVPPAQIPVRDPLDGTTIQNGTDRSWLQELAGRYGYIFGVRPTSVPLVNTAYWGPPLRLAAPQPALSVDLGDATNVTSLDFAYDAMAPTLIIGAVQDPITDLEIPVATVLSTRRPALAAKPALLANLPWGRKAIYENPAFSGLQAFAEAQGTTDVSTDRVVVAEGTLDTTRYGAVLHTPGIVGVRGAGGSYDGHYYVTSVTHQLAPGAYTQAFTLTREGLGSTVERVAV